MRIFRNRFVSLLLWALVVLASNPSIRGAGPQATPAGAQNAPSQSSAAEEKDTNHRDHADQDLVIEQSSTDVVFSDDGTGKQEQSVRIRIQSEAAVKQFGVLTFRGHANEKPARARMDGGGYESLKHVCAGWSALVRRSDKSAEYGNGEDAGH